MMSATMSPSRTPRRAGFGHALWAARIFFGGPGWGDLLWRLWPVVILLSVLGGGHDDTPGPIDDRVFFFFITIFMPWLSLATLFIESGQVRALAFLEILPQRARALQFILWPLRLFGIVAALALTVTGHLPPLYIAIFAGCFWWHISVGHWIADRGPWGRMLMFPLVWFHSIVVVAVVFGNYSPQVGLQVGAACAVIPALLALVVPNRNKLGRLLANETPAARAKRTPAASIHRVAFQSSVGPRRCWGTIYRVTKLANSSFAAREGWTAFGVVMIAAILVGVALVRHPSASVQWMVLAFCGARMLAKSNDGAQVEFLITRPLSRVRVFSATVLPWIGLVLVLPMEQLLLVKATMSSGSFYSVDRGTWRIIEMVMGISRQHLVKTDGGTSVAMTAEVLSYMYRDAYRAGFLALAALFSIALLSVAARAKRRLSWIARVLCLVVGVAALAPYVSLYRGLWWRPVPLWLAAILAAVSAGIFIRHVFGRAAP
jgi:hypothetical protein